MLTVQEYLWAAYRDGTTSKGSDISAMPSLHVAMAVLMALGTWRINRWIGAGMWAYALMIQIGSVHLAWHYAIDGFLAAVLTVGIWRLTGWWVERRTEEVETP